MGANPNRPPLRPSDRAHNNGIAVNPNPNPNPTRAKSKPVPSRYLLSPSSTSSSSSLSTPRRCPSPSTVSRTPAPASKPRSLSADRRRVSPLRRDDVATPTTTRTLSVSFQGESFSLPVRKTPASPATLRRRPVTPSVTRPDQHRWPGRVRQPDPVFVGSSLLRSFDRSGVDGGNAARIGSVAEPGFRKPVVRWNETDSDSVSSGSSGSGGTGFWHASLPKCPSPKRFPVEAPIRGFNNSNNHNNNSSSIRGMSPSRVKNGVDNNNNNNSNNSSSSRGMGSPCRVRVSISGGINEKPSVLSYAVDVKRGKMGENQISDAHCLRLLHNRHLQWRFVNARNDAVLSAQRRTVQTNLCNAWNTISNLRESVARKTHRLHLMKQKLKLADILKEQISFLEVWASLDKGHCTSLLGSIEALKGSTLRLPVVDGAITDLQSIKDAIGSAVDVMQAMGSSICSLLSKVEEMNFLASELTKEVSKEQALLEQCKVYFTKLAVQQVEYCSVRTHILQDNRTLPLLH